VTFRFAIIAIPLTMAASLGFALLVNSPKLFARNVFRSFIYMPIQIPLVASTLVWIGFLNTESGWLNGIIGFFGLQGPNWITSETWIYPALALIGLWGVGNFMLINIAGLQSVPTELYEAARIDGAGAWTMFRRITIPLISPILLYNLVISLITTFQYFTQAYTMTNGRGDPNNATLFINLDLFREAFQFNRMGYGAAIAWLLFVIVLILTLGLFALARKRSCTCSPPRCSSRPSVRRPARPSIRRSRSPAHTRAPSTRSTRCRSTGRPATSCSSTRAVSRASSSTRPTLPRPRSNGRDAGGR
jgi:multiple sugar transport system permease protein